MEPASEVIAIFLEDRKKAFETFTEDSIKAFALKYEVPLPKSPDVFWVGAHRARVHMTNIGVKYIAESVKWLENRGFETELSSEVREMLEAAGF